MQKVFIHMLLGIVAALIFSACSNDTDEITGKTHENVQKIVFNLTSSSLNNYDTNLQAFTNPKDDYIDKVDILAFRDNGSGNYTFEYRAKGFDIIQGSNAQFSTWLRQGTQTFIIIANASDILDNLTAYGDIALGGNLNDIFGKLIIASNDEWPTGQGSSAIKYIPMYTQISSNVTPSTSILDQGNDHYLIRMLARIDIGLKNVVTNFQLTEAYIFNRKNAGSIVYDNNKWNSSSKEITDPTLPVSIGTIKLPSATEGKYLPTATNEIKQSIYTFEASGTELRQNATAIVVGGIFNTDLQTSYYRVDIPATLPNYASGDILRNHLYNIIISKVSKTGASTPEVAFDGDYTLEAEVEDWTNADNDIIIDPQYYLYIDEPDILLTYAQSANGYKINVLTNHPDGITIENITAGVTVKIDSAVGNNKVLTIKSQYTGSFYVKAGNLKVKVKIA